MVPFDVVTSGNRMLSNLSESFEVLSLSVMQSSFSFADVKSITLPATGFVDKLRQSLGWSRNDYVKSPGNLLDSHAKITGQTQRLSCHVPLL